jgi:hypothetical protein
MIRTSLWTMTTLVKVAEELGGSGEVIIVGRNRIEFLS